MFDVIIIGSRCAGSSLAVRLAKLDCRILIIDKADFPSDTNSTHIFGETDFFLENNLVSSFNQINSPQIKRMRININRSSFESNITMTERLSAMDRYSLDNLLINKLDDYHNVIFRKKSKLVSVQENDDGYTVRYQYEDKIHIVSCKVLIGADGKNSTVARKVKASMAKETDKTYPCLYGYFENVFPLMPHCLEWHYNSGDIIICAPTNDKLHVVLLIPMDNRELTKYNKVEAFINRITSFPCIEDRFKNANLVGKLKGIGDQNMFIRKPFGKRWALVGDACSWVHPISGSGIDDAFEGSRLLAKYLEGYLKGEESWESSMNKYSIAIEGYMENQISRVLSTFDNFNVDLPNYNEEILQLFCTFPSLIYSFAFKAEQILKEFDGNHLNFLKTIVK
ncbi:NAD(P)/FAD-dependent oxidoreductase [Virgibacillus dokdonensis]|uniref:NAD(P)/FAD-dependent oxidoreductase n=1 Tax=Virgibacillus dokdonensis TaxID=302167 RepID=UPI00098B4B34|nr:NAD(P)/FAD-dependent oxidoreductase [Virgibacillus dokdonensis]